MFDAVVYIDIRQVKVPSAVRPPQDVRDVARHIKTE